jgi:DNA end-binding protein Ku
MQTVWKGAISFGLINVPVKMGAATQRENIAFRQLHKACNTPINQKRWCSACNREVAYEEIVRGYEYEPGKYVLISEEDLEALPVKSAKYIDIMDFIQLNEVDPVYYDKTYYLWPEKGGEKPYLILRDAMKATGKAAVAKVTIREKEHLCLVRLVDETLSLSMMFFHDEIRSTAELGIAELSQKVAVRPEETEMAVKLVENLTAPFAPEKYHDDYREELLKLIRAKVEGQEIVQVEEPIREPSANVVDLMERLRQSVEATQKKEESKRNVPKKKKASGG